MRVVHYGEEPDSDLDVPLLAAAAQELSRREELRGEISMLGRRIGSNDVAAAVLIGILASIPSTPLDSQVAEWLSQRFDLPLPQFRGQGSVGKASAEVLAALQRSRKIDLGPVLAATPPGQPPSLVSLIRNATSGTEIQAETVATEFAKLIDFDDVVGLGISKALTKVYTKRYGLVAGSVRYHEFMALTFAVQAIVSGYWNFNPIISGLALWHLGKCIWLGGVLANQYLELTAVAVAESEAAIAAWRAEVEQGKWVREMMLVELERPFPAGGTTFDSSGFGD